MVQRTLCTPGLLHTTLQALWIQLSTPRQSLQVTFGGQSACLRRRVIEKKLDVAQEAPKTVWLAQDEASLYLQATTSCVWAPRGQTPVVRIHPGREKISFYGTLNLVTGQEIAMPSTVMNGEATARHLQQILDNYPDVPIVLLWDRAPWHSGAPIRDLLDAHPRLEIIHFPVAAPDLNPQEHVWKATRRAVSHNHLLQKLPDLADRFEQHLLSTTFHPSLLDDPVFQMVCAMSK